MRDIMKGEEQNTRSTKKIHRVSSLICAISVIAVCIFFVIGRVR